MHESLAMYIVYGRLIAKYERFNIKQTIESIVLLKPPQTIYSPVAPIIALNYKYKIMY